MTIYVCDSNIEHVIKVLEEYATRLSTWYPENYLILNVEKCHLLTFGGKSENTC